MPPEPHQHSMLLTDLYELTMAAAFFENNYAPTASFEIFVRRMPPNRGYLLVAGIEQALEYLERARFHQDEIDFLRSHPAFRNISGNFFEYLKNVKFSGEVWAMPEGTPFFPEEPIVRVTAPLIEAQVVETYLLSAITFQSMIASKASRVAEAAERRSVVEFGSRRAHGPEAGVLAARAAYIGGCTGTSNVEAGFRFGIPTKGTIAHSFVMAMPDEESAFEAYSKLFPETNTLLVDTYDTLAAVDKIIRAGLKPQGIRIDSGDLVQLSIAARRKLDAAGLKDTQIFASGDLDEFVIAALIAKGAKIDAFGVGTSLATSRDAPALGGVYKLVEVRSETGKSYLAKFSQDKMTYPGTKQVYRYSGDDGAYEHDLVACAGERVTGATSLLRCVMKEGKRLQPPPKMEDVRSHAHDEVAKLPKIYRQLQDPPAYPVEFSQELKRLLEQVRSNVMPVNT